MIYYRKFTLAFVFFFLTAQVKFILADQTHDKIIPKLERAIYNFHEIEPGVYRSGRLPQESYPYLQKLGIKTVVNFIDRKEEVEEENENLSEFGIKMISIPWNGFDYPKDKDVDKFLEIMRDPKERPILVHCKRGAERTGLMIGCWRIAQKKWRAGEAYQEMKASRFRAFWYGHLKKYLDQFANRYGQTVPNSNNILEKAKTNFLYALYRIHKLNPSN